MDDDLNEIENNEEIYEEVQEETQQLQIEQPKFEIQISQVCSLSVNETKEFAKQNSFEYDESDVSDDLDEDFKIASSDEENSDDTIPFTDQRNSTTTQLDDNIVNENDSTDQESTDDDDSIPIQTKSVKRQWSKKTTKKGTTRPAKKVKTLKKVVIAAAAAAPPPPPPPPPPPSPPVEPQTANQFIKHSIPITNIYSYENQVFIQKRLKNKPKEIVSFIEAHFEENKTDWYMHEKDLYKKMYQKCSEYYRFMLEMKFVMPPEELVKKWIADSYEIVYIQK